MRLTWRDKRPAASAATRPVPQAGWGNRDIHRRLTTDLRAAFPDMRGPSRSNRKDMPQMAAAWREEAIGQQPVGRLPLGYVTVLLDKLDDQAQRDWYAAFAVEHGWFRNVLLQQLMNQLHRRVGVSPPISRHSSRPTTRAGPAADPRPLRP